MTSTGQNPFLEKPLIALYLRTALPIILLLGVHGFIAIADAWFLGRFVGPEALAAVTLIFPFYMGVVALSSLVSAGSSSMIARHLGAGAWDRAREVFAQAHGRSLLLFLALLAVFSLFGTAAARLAADGDAALAELALPYLQITILTAPLTFLLTLHTRALQNQGHIRFMTVMSLIVSAANIGFNFAFIVWMGLGVVGSALGTAAAQALGLGLVYAFGLSEATRFSVSDLFNGQLFRAWHSILALGASHSLGLLAVSLASLSIIAVLQGLSVAAYADTVSSLRPTHGRPASLPRALAASPCWLNLSAWVRSRHSLRERSSVLQATALMPGPCSNASGWMPTVPGTPSTCSTKTTITA